jgi:putative aldouronate transport system substrate-binding protein
VDATNKTYGLNIGWELPNQFISHIWEGNTPDIWSNMKKDIDNSERSKALGFTYDPTTVQNQITALLNVKNEYYDAIGSGSVDPKTAIPKFNYALYNAGLQDVINLKQEQLDAWLAN